MTGSIQRRQADTGGARRARRRDVRRLGILKAAARIFHDRGVAEAGMRDIAEAADLSPANLYHYFSGKDEILFFCQERSLSRLLEALKESRRAGTSAADRLERVLRAHAGVVLGEVEGGAAHLAVDALSEPRRRRIVARRDRYEQGVRQLVAQGIRNGEFIACDAAITTRAMLGAVNSTATWFRPDGSRPAASVAQALANYLVRGLRAHQNGHRRS